MSTTPLYVIVNIGGGAAAQAGDALIDQVTAAFTAADREITVEAVAGDAIADRIAVAAKSGAVVVGGGDGTQGTAAAICARAGATLGILPLGTRNHLARELGIPMDLAGAAQVIAAGRTCPIDLSQVNDTTFVNNVSIGFYPQMVRTRDALRERHGLPKWLANLPAGWATLRALRHRRFALSLDGAVVPVRTSLLFVGNNVYSLEPGKLGQRDALDDGKLSVFALAPNDRLGIIGFALRALIGRSNSAQDFAALGVCERLVVQSRRRTIEVAIDGELVALVPPLIFITQPLALTVFVPENAA